MTVRLLAFLSWVFFVAVCATAHHQSGPITIDDVLAGESR